MARYGTAKACRVPLKLWAADCEIDVIRPTIAVGNFTDSPEYSAHGAHG
jgi:hypothetical protein